MTDSANRVCSPSIDLRRHKKNSWGNERKRGVSIKLSLSQQVRGATSVLHRLFFSSFQETKRGGKRREAESPPQKTKRVQKPKNPSTAILRQKHLKRVPILTQPGAQVVRIIMFGVFSICVALLALSCNGAVLSDAVKQRLRNSNAQTVTNFTLDSNGPLTSFTQIGCGQLNVIHDSNIQEPQLTVETTFDLVFQIENGSPGEYTLSAKRGQKYQSYEFVSETGTLMSTLSIPTLMTTTLTNLAALAGCDMYVDKDVLSASPSLTAASGGKLSLAGEQSFSSLQLTAQSGGSMCAKLVSLRNLKCAASSGGMIYASALSDVSEVEVTGVSGGSANLCGLPAADVTATLSSGGYATVNANQNLALTASSGEYITNFGAANCPEAPNEWSRSCNKASSGSCQDTACASIQQSATQFPLQSCYALNQ